MARGTLEVLFVVVGDVEDIEGFMAEATKTFDAHRLEITDTTVFPVLPDDDQEG
jgi:hypothetical protein